MSALKRPRTLSAAFMAFCLCVSVSGCSSGNAEKFAADAALSEDEIKAGSDWCARIENPIVEFDIELNGWRGSDSDIDVLWSGVFIDEYEVSLTIDNYDGQSFRYVFSLGNFENEGVAEVNPNSSEYAEAEDEDKDYRFIFTDAYTLHVSGWGDDTRKFIRSTED